jgi:hypothetical protein
MYALLALALLQIPSPSPQSEKPIVKHSKADNKAAERTQSSPVIPPSVPVGTSVSQPSATPEKDKHDGKSDERIYRVDVVPHPFDWRDALYVVYILATAGAGIVAWRALLAIREQARLMKDQLIEIRKTRQRTVTEMHAAGEQTREMLTHIKAQVGHMKTLASATKDSADTSKIALEEAERADVLLDGISFADEQSRIYPLSRPIFHFKNSGRTRAINVRFDFQMAVPDALPARQPDMPTITIGSQCEQLLTFSTVIESFTMQIYHDVINGRVALTFDGKVFYDDVFGKPHWARYSGTYDPKTRCFKVGEHETD